jgi:hypothetical protein
VLVPGIRKAFTLLCVVGMVVWLLVDIFYQDANGLVPGALPLSAPQHLLQQPLHAATAVSHIVCHNTLLPELNFFELLLSCLRGLRMHMLVADALQMIL